MSNAALIAEAQSLMRRADDLWKQSEALSKAECAAAGVSWSYGFTCDDAKPLHAEGHSLRARAEALLAQSRGGPPAPAAAAPATAQSTNPAIDAIVAQAMANLRAPSSAGAVALPFEIAAQIAAREAETRALESDALVANICGNVSVAELTAQRHARERELAANAADAHVDEDREAEVDALVAAILAA